MRGSSIRLHLGLAIGLTAVQAFLLAIGGVAAPLNVASAVATVALLTLLLRTFSLHRERRHRLLDILESVRRAAAGDTHVQLPAGEEDEAGKVADAVNRLLHTIRSREMAAHAERDLDLAMVRETPNGLVVIDKKGLVQRANPALARLLPINGNPVGKRPIETIPVPAFQDVIDSARERRETCELSVSYGQKSLLVRAMPTADGQGCLGVVLDITNVTAAERVRREFVANVSHEVRTPITAIVGYVEALDSERDRLPADIIPMLDAVRRNSERLHLLVEDVLHLSRIEAREGDLELAREPIQAVISTVVERFAGVATRRQIALSQTAPTSAYASINADALEHALSNLVDNALKYTPEGGHVALSVVELPQWLEVTVADDGPGIDAVHHPRIFERFYRVDPGRSRGIGGTGLGLALVKHLCAAMNVEIRLESRLGEGAAFTLRIPRGDDE